METVKQFLPQIIKLAVILLLTLLLITVLIFNAVPHFLFGWMDNNSADIKSMTDKAAFMAGIYDRFDDLNQAETDRLIQQLSEGYTDVDVTSDVRNTNLVWLIAITSVYYQQDLSVLDENAIQDMISGKLTYSSSLADNKLSLNISDLDPQSLMTKLNFTDEQRAWVDLLVSGMTDSQTISSGDASFLESYGTDYGSITYMDGETEVVYYNQADSRWGSTMYGKSGTIGKAGCGPTALAIAVSSLSDKIVTPKEVASWSYQNGYRVENNGSKHKLIPDGAKHYGLSVEGVGRDGQKCVDALSSGKLVVAIMSKGHFTSQGHFIVLRGVTEDGRILVADPISIKRSNQLWDLELILNEVNRGAAAGGPLWVISN